MSRPLAPPGMHVVDVGTMPAKARPDWFNFASRVAEAVTALRSSGTTANRPTVGLFIGRTYFDTTLGKPVWHDGSGWVDATGASA